MLSLDHNGYRAHRGTTGAQVNLCYGPDIPQIIQFSRYRSVPSPRYDRPRSVADSPPVLSRRRGQTYLAPTHRYNICAQGRIDQFTSNIDTPRGYSLSPVLFVVYLEAALRDLSDSLNMDAKHLYNIIIYADEADFISQYEHAIAHIITHAPAVLARSSLTMNISKTEPTVVARSDSPSTDREARARDEGWRITKKLGSLLADHEDLRQCR
ncbi:Endonuclease Reverse transcriptase [Phytophthora megakarya]|uniref:Endonuclease Reverse transcriptase n=1 Tax=Phytophthora megakarya TaxID=4795 RepID=A0A225VMK2_9STRA|nr:Endonuclease Reverse transcriptase [Phytophthora megakarya]